MAKRNKEPFEDDGRTIVDMSGIDAPNLFGFRPPSQKRGKKADPTEQKADRPWEEQPSLTKEQSRSYILGALGAAMLIAAIFIVAGAIAIGLMVAFWK